MFKMYAYDSDGLKAHGLKNILDIEIVCVNTDHYGI